MEDGWGGRSLEERNRLFRVKNIFLCSPPFKWWAVLFLGKRTKLIDLKTM
jgi:hypothetical protein